MVYYIKTNKDTTKDVKYKLSEPFTSQQEAEEKLEKMHKENRENSEVIALPSSIRDGLVLYKNNKYWKTLIASSKNLWFAQINLDDKSEIPDPIRKEKLIDWYVNKIINSIEEYNDNIEFHDVQDLGNYEPNNNIKNYDEEE